MQDGAAQAPALPEYKVEEMTFEMDEETIPAYKPPKVDDSDEEEEPGPSNGKASGDEGVVLPFLFLVKSVV